MKSKARFAESAAQEVVLGDYIPYTSHVTDHIIKTRDGDYLAVWQVDGIPFETTDQVDLNTRHEGLNQFLCGLGDGAVSIWTHRVRRSMTDRLSEDYAEEFAQEMAKRYYSSFGAGRMKSNDSYFTVVYRPKKAGVPKLFRKTVRSLEEIREAERDGIRQMTEIINQVNVSLKKYEPYQLGIYREGDKEFSQALEFLGYLANGALNKVGVQRSQIHGYLGTSRLFFEKERIEILMPEGKRYGAILDIKEYPAQSKPGILNELLYANYEYIETQSFSIMRKPEAIEALERQQKQLMSGEDAAESQILALTEALDQLVDGQFVLGQYHYSLAVFADTPEQVGKNLSHAKGIISDAGFQSAVTDLVSDGAWFAQLPANWKYRPREAKITSRNFAGISSLHSFGAGKRNMNPWGEAVTILKTPNGAPYYFNFHGTPEEDDSSDKKVPANTTIIGMTGSGKTVLEMFLLLMTLKYRPTIVFFDKDRGAEIAIRAMGGNYRCFKRGQPTGMNPLQLPVTEANLSFLNRLVKSLIPRELTPQEEAVLSESLREIMKMERPLRRLATLAQMLPLNQTDGGMPAYLRKWCAGGSLGWVLDNADDKIDLTKDTLIGFDDTDFLEDKEILAPTTMYLLHSTQTLIDGRRFIYVMAEFWKRLELPEFTDFAVNKQYTIRKQNGFGIFDTQSPAQILKSTHVAAMVEQSATQIFLPNPKADRKDYINGFKVTEAEFKKIVSLGESSRQFLVKQGHRSTVVTLDLAGLGNEMLDILSTTADNVELLDEIRQERGDRPEAWLPEFKRRLEERRNRAKKF